MLSTITRYSPLALITAPKIHTNLLWDLTILFVGIAVLYFIGVFYFRNKLSSQNKIISQKKRDLSPIISEFLFFEENSSKDEKTNYIKLKIEIRQFLKDTFNRRILSEVLLDLGKDVSGKTQESLFTLYKELELHKDAYKKLESWRWELVSKGIFELTQMHVAESYGFITKFINDKRGTIRKQAEIATVTLKHEGISHFLDTTRYKISEWQQLKLLEVLRTQNDFQPPKFKQWLTSGNKHVVLFSLRLIKHYNQNDAELSIIELVKHKNTQIKEEAIICIKEFAFLKATDTLKLVFWNCSANIKIAILDALSVIGKEDDLPFLSQIEFKERNFSVKSKALSTINTIAPETILPTEGIETNIHHNIPKDIEIALVEEKNIAASTKNIDSMDTNKENEEIISTIKNSDSVESEDIKDVIQEIRKEELNSIIKAENSNKEEKINIDFLPIISSEATKDKDIQEPSKNNKINNDAIKDIVVNFQTVVGKNIKDMEVIFEIVKPIFNTQTTKEFNIDFLPFITTKKIENTPDLSNFYKQVPDIIYDNNFSKTTKEDIVVNFIPVVYEEVEPFLKPDSLKEIDIQNIKNIEIIYEEVKVDIIEKLNVPNLPREIDLLEYDVDFTTIFFNKEEDENIEKNTTQSILNSIPKPIFYSKKELEMFVALEDIDAFGDAREIPLLQEFLTKEEGSSPIRERIVEILDKLHKQIEINNQEVMRIKDEECLSEINLIEELFANCDTESKLILLDEIVAVGDKKELRILNKLLNDSDNAVRLKALVCIAQLQHQINLKEEKILNLVSNDEPQETKPIPLEYAFFSDYETELKKNNIQPAKTIKEPVVITNNEVVKKEASFLEQFYSFSSKLFEKFNG